jgi:hypothetical protein
VIAVNSAKPGLGTAIAILGAVFRTSTIFLTITMLLYSAPARAENCVSKDKLAPGDTGRPCWDVGSSFGRIENYASPGRNGLRLDSRVSGPRILFATNGQTIDDPTPRTTISIDGGVWEVLNFGDGEYKLKHYAGMRYQRDSDDWGAYVGGFAVSKWHEQWRIITPTLGLRLGRFDRAALVAEARFAGLYLYSPSEQPRSFTDNVDVTMRGTVVLAPFLRLEARARLRNITIDEQLRQSDAMLAVGVQGVIPGKLGFRIVPTFLGIGVRYVSGNDEWKYHPVRERDMFMPVEERGLQVMVMVDADMGLNSSARIW